MDSSYYAALDLGSNSFHLLVVKESENGMQAVDKIKHMVRLGEGLQDNGELDEQSFARGLTALAQMRQRIAHIPEQQIRAVGTNTLRVAKNGQKFLSLGEQALGAPIEIISGQEEARLIYLGVCAHHGLTARHLIIDIGGGSTEIIAGEVKGEKGAEAKILRSLKMGCANIAKKHFAKGKISKSAIKKAISQVSMTIEPDVELYRTFAPQQVILSSGTAKAVEKALQVLGIATDATVSLAQLHALLEQLLKIADADKLPAALGIDAARAFGFTAGVCILVGVFEQLGIERASVSQQALREGVILEMIKRSDTTDQRADTVRAFQQRFTIDTAQAARVSELALYFNQSLPINAPKRFAPLLAYAAALHEIGLAVSRHKQQQHGAYLLENADMLGFSALMQQMMALLVKGQRRKLPIKAIEAVAPHYQAMLWQFLLSLRLSVVICRARIPIAPCDYPVVLLKENVVHLRFSSSYLQAHPLTLADLEEEALYWQASAPYRLQIDSIS